MMSKFFKSLAVLAVVLTATQVAAQDGLVAVDIDIDLVSTSPTVFCVEVNVRHFLTIASFLFEVGVGSFGGPGAVITGFTDVSNVAANPAAITIVDDNILSGGITGVITMPVGFIFLLPNCVQGLNCFDNTIFQTVIKFDVEVPDGTVADDIFIGTPNGPNEPSFGTVELGSIPVDLDVPAPAPAPLPLSTPAPAPFDARSISDPHMYGFNGQKFQFHGEPGKMYNLISDPSVGLAINALFAVAYTSGVSADTDTLVVSPYVAQGTWVKAIGIKSGASALLIDSTDTGARPCTSEGCFMNGAVNFNGNPVQLLGNYGDEDFTITLKNSKSYSRVEVSCPVLTGKVDVVAPPAMWNVPRQEIPDFTHINLIVEKVSLADGHGILGETISIRHDATGNPVMESNGDNGEGLLMMTPEEYEVRSLL